MSCSFVFRYIMIGDAGKLIQSGVGKSSILQQFVHNTFSDDYGMTVGVELLSKIISIGGDNIKLQIWDTVSVLVNFIDRPRKVCFGDKIILSVCGSCSYSLRCHK